MAKNSNKKIKSDIIQLNQDHFTQLDQPEFWEIVDPNDQTFWNEFFQIEEILNLHDELDPPTFSITIQNQKTGEVRSYPHVRLGSARKKTLC